MELFQATQARTPRTSTCQNIRQRGKMYLDHWITMVSLEFLTAKVMQVSTLTSTAQNASRTNQWASSQVWNRYKIQALVTLLLLATKKSKAYSMVSNRTNVSCTSCLQMSRIPVQHNKYNKLHNLQVHVTVNLQSLSAQISNSVWV